MIKPVYFDTTTFVKIFKLEWGSDFAKLIVELSRKTSDFYQISMSEWTINEAISAIDQSVKTGEMSRKQSDDAIGLLLIKIIEYTQPPYHMQFIEVSRSLVESSRRLIKEYQISADDALHFYTAYSNDCEFFITADKEIKKKMDKSFWVNVDSEPRRSSKIRVLNIQNEKDMISLFLDSIK